MALCHCASPVSQKFKPKAIYKIHPHLVVTDKFERQKKKRKKKVFPPVF